MSRAVLLAFPLLLAACAPRPPAAGAQGDDAAMARLSAELDEAIGVPRASNDARCQVVAVGRKACGGPREYRVYSTEGRDAARVRRIAAEYTALDSLRNERLGLASDCAMAVPPEVRRLNGVCVAR